MTNVKEVVLTTNRIQARAYDVLFTIDSLEGEPREFSNVNNAFAAHTVLREIISQNRDSQIKLKTNVTALLIDIETLDTNPRTLTRYLRSVLESSNVQIISAEYVAI